MYTPDSEQTKDNQEEPLVKNLKIRSSLLPLLAKLVSIELLFSLLHWVLRREAFVVVWEEAFPSIFLFLRGFEALVLLYVFLRWFRKIYVITPEEVVLGRGVLYSRIKIFAIKNIESLALHQNIIQKIFRYGTLRLYAPTLNERIYLRSIPRPKRTLEIIESLMPKAHSSGEKGPLKFINKPE